MDGATIIEKLTNANYGILKLATLAITIVAAVAAIYIGYQAIRGLRRHDSRPMRYLSIGLLVLFGVTYVVSFTGTMALRGNVIALRYQPLFRFTVRLLQLIGLLAISYSLYLVRTEKPTLTLSAEGEGSESD